MRTLHIRAGQRFGRLVIIEEVEKQSGYRRFRLRCDCGNEIVTRLNLLRNSHTRSCGCLKVDLIGARRRTHGRSRDPIYHVWQGMRGRCEQPRHKSYADYGGRGIKVCARWQSFENFLADMGERPDNKHEIERIDSYGNYEPGNCRWATRDDTGHNRRAPRTKRSSRYRGVDRHPAGWRARITIDKRVITIGTYADEDEAARAYDNAARPHGFPLNFPDL